VKSDMRALVCVLANCKSPSSTFVRKQEWIEHMTLEHESHKVRWVCRIRTHHSPVVFEGPDAGSRFDSHMESDHAGSFTRRQLPILRKRSSESAAQMFRSCPLCGWGPEGQEGDREKTLVLQNHIAEHLEAVALSSLPGRDSEDEMSWGSSSSSPTSTRSSDSSRLRIRKATDDYSIESQSWDVSSDDDRYLKATEGLPQRNHQEDSEYESWDWIYYALANPGSAYDPRPADLNTLSECSTLRPCMLRSVVIYISD
jgi:hypothetical protein